MSNGPGLTGDKNFEYSCEVFHKGSDIRQIIYGRRRDAVLADIAKEAHRHFDADWMDDYVVIERRVPMGLGPMWARVARRFDEYGERV